MSNKQDSNVVHFPDLRVSRRKKLSTYHWWRAVHPLRLVQVPVVFLIFFTTVSAVVAVGKESYKAGASFWETAFCLTLFFIFLEYKFRAGFYMVNKPD